MQQELITHTIQSRQSSMGSSTLVLVANSNTGESTIEVTKTFIETYPLTEYDQALILFNRLNRNGRKIVNLKDL